MINKVIIGILVFLMILSGGLCYYSYTLSEQVYSLSEQLTTFQEEQATRIGAISDELLTLRGETVTRFNALQNEIDETLIRIDTLEDNVSGTLATIGTLEVEMGRTLTNIDNLENKIASVAGEVSKSVMNASAVYQRVNQATVEISDGERTIGSGFILDSEAHVVTAQHVVENLSKIYVVLPDGRVFKAADTGGCPFSDIAVLTVKGELLIEPPPLADSDEVQIGEPVAVIGNPFELPETLTVGIVSQTNRFAEIEYGSQTRWVANLIQFDAAVNFGNSGCPLMNSEGEVIGMVIARVNPDEGDGIYYAVSSNKVKRVATSIIAQGFFDYPWVGVNIANLTPQTVQARDLETANGVLVTGVFADSPAEAAGIKVDDIIVAMDGLIIRNAADLTAYLGEHKSPDELATLELMRDTTKLELSLEIGKRTP